ncbi:MAG: hypothetical protein ACJA14_001339 [Ilumatobacter sp.]|jgi:hypothetical protein
MKGAPLSSSERQTVCFAGRRSFLPASSVVLLGSSTLAAAAWGFRACAWRTVSADPCASYASMSVVVWGQWC